MKRRRWKFGGHVMMHRNVKLQVENMLEQRFSLCNGILFLRNSGYFSEPFRLGKVLGSKQHLEDHNKSLRSRPPAW